MILLIFNLPIYLLLLGVRPLPEVLSLSGTILNVQPGVTYNLYRYSDRTLVPSANFNSATGYTSKVTFTGQYGQNSYNIMQFQISSSDQVFFRCVPAPVTVL